jgi:hypothetical protein
MKPINCLRLFLVGTLVILILLNGSGSSPTVSLAAPAFLPERETEIPAQEVIDRLSGWFSSDLAGACYNNWARIGDIGKVRERFGDGDIQVYIDPPFLDETGAAAAYVDYSAAGLGYFNDIVLADVPANVPAQTLWHETMHAIFDDHDSELSDIGTSTDEIYTWYMELALNAVRNTLSQYEQELKKGEDCDSEKLQRRWDLFVRQMEDARNANGYGYISDAGIRQLESLTGFHVDVEEIRKGYASGTCGECGAATTSGAGTAGALDLIFCIDVTGSMEDDIGSVKAAASNIVNAVAAKNDDYRVAIIAYRDWDDSEGYAMFEDYAFSSSRDAIIGNINRLSVGGGDDEPEAVFEALMRAIDSRSVGGWRANVNKQVILMGDAPPHDPSRQGYTASIVAKAAWDADPVVIQSLVVGNDGLYNSTAVEAFQELAELTDGGYFEAENADAVPEVLQKTIEVIETSVSGSSEMDLRLIFTAAGALLCLAGLGLLLMLLLVRAGRRRKAVQPAHQAAMTPAPTGGWSQQPPPLQAGPAPVSQRAPQDAKTFVHTPAATTELVIVEGIDAGQRFPLRPSNRLGRSSDNEIVLQDKQVSRHHAVLTFSGAGYVVTDLGSANGTWVNGVRIVQPTQLRSGDVITLGAEKLVLQGPA